MSMSGKDLRRRLALEEAKSAARRGNVKGVQRAFTGTGLDFETQNLIGQKNRLEAQAKMFGAKKKKGGPSILSRAFDVLSRGQYASAGAVQGALKEGGRGGVLGSLIDAATGAKKGLEGKRKLSYSNVLEEHGVKNKWVRGIGGLAGDILLDPTTYIGAGLVKGVGKEVAEASSAKLASGAVESFRKSGLSERVAQRAKKAFEEEKFLETGKFSAKESKKIGKEAVQQTEERIMNETTKDALVETPNKIQLRFARKTIAESAGAAKALKAPGRAVGKTQVGQDLKKLFSTKANIGPLDPKRRMFIGRSVAEMVDYAHEPVVKLGNKEYTWQTIGDVVTKDEMKDFVKAYERGDILELPPSKSGIDWDDLAESVRGHYKRLDDHDIHEGLRNPEKSPSLENYMYHHYQVPEGKSRAFKADRRRVIESDAYKPAMERKIPSLEKAEAAGLKPTYDLREIMLKRAAKSYSATARKNYIVDAVESMGTKADKDVAKTLNSKGHTLVNVRRELAKGLSKEEKQRALQFLDGDEYLPRSVVDHLTASERIFRAPEEVEGLLNIYDNVLTKWKGVATVYNPGHHIRNLSTDIYLNYVDGVRNPRVYGQAMDILFRGTEGYIKINGQKIAKADILREFKDSGAAPGWIATNVDEGGRLFKGKVTRALHTGSGKREEFGRLAHWIDAVGKEGGGKSLRDLSNLQEAGRKAAERVRHWNIDYTDLTPFERSVMKRVVPFYTWMRHSTPLMIEAIATRPGKVAVVPKGMNALQQLLGVDPDESLPIDLIPKWLREMGGVQIGQRGGNPLFQTPFAFPGMETANLAEGGSRAILGNLASQTSPMIRAPLELAAGRTFFGNMPITDTKQYALNMFPQARTFSTIQATRNDPEKSDVKTRLLNYLLGVGQQEVTPNRIRGELRRQMDPLEEYVRQARKRAGG